MSKLINFFFLFGVVFESRFGPILIPKLVQNLLIFGPILDPFFLGFRSSLGASWEPSWASWGSLGRPQERKNADSPTRKPLFWKCSFLVLWSSWWLSWAHLAPSLADLVPKWAPKCFPKMLKKETNNCPILLFFYFFQYPNTREKNKKSTVLKHNLDQPFCTNSKTDLQKKQNEPKKQSLALKRQKNWL